MKRFGWRDLFQGIPVIFSIIVTLVGVVIFITQMNSRLGYIEKDHRVFGSFYQRQIDEIKAGILRIEEKIERIR